MQQTRRVKEEYAIVLDYLRQSYPEDSRPFHQREPIVQAIGKEHFVLLELVPAPDVNLKPHDEVYIGDKERKGIIYIRGILVATKLTQTAKTELPFVVEKLVDNSEARFVQFFNTSGPISLRAHQLELLPGVGKRHTKLILEAREEKLFESFAEIKKRVSAMPDPKKAIISRILLELEDGDRHKLFVRV